MTSEDKKIIQMGRKYCDAIETMIREVPEPSVPDELYNQIFVSFMTAASRLLQKYESLLDNYAITELSEYVLEISECNLEYELDILVRYNAIGEYLQTKGKAI